MDDLENIIFSGRNQRKINAHVWNLKGKTKEYMTNQKQVHRHREQTGGYQWGGASQVVLTVKKLPANTGDINRCGFNPWVPVGKIPWRRAWQAT